MAEEEDPRLEDGEMDVEAHISWALGVVGEVSLGDAVLAGEPHPSLLPSLVTREQHREQERRCRYEVEAERRGILEFMDFDQFYWDEKGLQESLEIARLRGLPRAQVPWILKTAVIVKKLRERKQLKEDLETLDTKIMFATRRRDEILALNEDLEAKIADTLQQIAFNRKFRPMTEKGPPVGIQSIIPPVTQDEPEDLTKGSTTPLKAFIPVTL